MVVPAVRLGGALCNVVGVDASSEPADALFTLWGGCMKPREYRLIWET